MERATIKPIGKGQYTLPQEWRKKLGIDKSDAIAEFTGSEIIIRPKEKLDWKIEKISFNTLTKEDKDLISKANTSYKSGKKKDFTTIDEVFGK